MAAQEPKFLPESGCQSETTLKSIATAIDQSIFNLNSSSLRAGLINPVESAFRRTAAAFIRQLPSHVRAIKLPRKLPYLPM